MNRLIEIFGMGEAQQLDESSLPLLITIDESANIALSSHVDSGEEAVAYLAESREHLFLQPADDAAVEILYHNDEPLSGSVWLKSGDTTRIGDTLLRWKLSGQRLEVHISEAAGAVLRPPSEPPEHPPGTQADGLDDEQELPVMPVSRPTGKNYRNPVLALFTLLLIATLFVLLANPLSVTVTPLPDSLSLSGFPPPIKFGGNYLAISGNYSVRAEKTGYLPLEERVSVSGGNNRYSFTLEKLPGLIDLSSSPAGVTVLIDGASVGETPLRDVEISTGERRVRFEHKRYLPYETVIEIAGLGKRENLHVELEPAWAAVTLQTEPAGATLTVDGKQRGQTPLEVELIAGERKLLFSKENFIPLEVNLVVTAGGEVTPDTYRLVTAPTTVNLSSKPSGAAVTVDNHYKGLTPLSIELASAKEHDLRLTLAGHQTASRKLKLDPGKTQDLDVKLEPEYGTLFIVGTPADATLYIDGKKQAKATGRFQLTTRAHKIELRAKGFQSATRKVTPRAGYSQRVEITLQRNKTSSPAVKPEGPEPVVTSKLGQKLVLIAPRPFRMGASRTEAGRRANESEHDVTMKRSFYLATQEVTNAAYKRFKSQHSSGMVGNRSLDVDAHPVVNVSWDDAARFLNWLSQQDGLPPFYREEGGRMIVADKNSSGYRLPTEAEWAFAARMAKQNKRQRYPWPGKYPPPDKAGNFADESARHLLPVVIAGYSDGFPATAPVGSFSANPAGIQDLGGNVAEWCLDYYAANPATAGKGVVDPTGAARGSHHVVRGSSWRDASITELRFSYRRYSQEPANDIGFRIARYAQ